MRALLFWPAILGTAANANEAMAAADSRKVHLANQMNQKNCAIPNGPVVAESATAPNPATASAVTAAPKSKEEQLAELKRLFDGNLISKEAYADRQKVILSGS